MFPRTYGITDFCLVLACHDSVFWLEDPCDVIYFWSCIDNSMICEGNNMEEALTLKFMYLIIYRVGNLYKSTVQEVFENNKSICKFNCKFIRIINAYRVVHIV